MLLLENDTKSIGTVSLGYITDADTVLGVEPEEYILTLVGWNGALSVPISYLLTTTGTAELA